MVHLQRLIDQVVRCNDGVEERRLSRLRMTDDITVEDKTAVLVALSYYVSGLYLYWIDHVLHLSTSEAGVNEKHECALRILAERFLP